MHANITWQCAHFSEFSAAQLYAVLSMRSEVFIVEQNCVYQDMDGVDIDCLHVIGWTSDQQVAAYMRIVPPGRKFAEVSLGRVITSNTARGTGIGKQLLTRGLELIAAHYPGLAIRIHAQAYLEKFYGTFGFVTVSDVFMEDNIPHCVMMKAAAI
jgi:ElaA protein